METLLHLLSGHSANVGSSQDCPAALRGIALFFVSALCSISLLASAAFTLSKASGVMVCASRWNNCCACQEKNCKVVQVSEATILKEMQGYKNQ